MQRHAGTPGAPKRLSKRTLLFYSLPNISISVAQLPIGIYLNDLYTTALGVSLGLVGIAIFVSRLTDVVTDPIIGSLSDNWQTRFGRRKLWVFLGTPLMIASLWFLFVPPDGADVWWLFVFICLFYLANTMIDLPYRAWGADLSTDYGERSHVTGWREAFGFIGNLVVFAVPIYMIFALGQTKITDWTLGIALVTAISLPVFVLVALIFVPEPPRERVQRGPVDWKGGLRLVWRNGAFRRLALMGLIFTVAIGTTTATSLYFVDHVMGVRRIYPYILFGYFMASIIGIPIWAAIARRIGKHKATALAILWLSIWSAPIPFLDAGDFNIFLALMLLKGSAIGALLFLPVSMAADVVDLDTLRSGRQRTGLYFAIWGMIVKLAAGIAGLMVGVVGAAGFNSACASPGKMSAAMAFKNPDASPEQLATLVREGLAAADCVNSDWSLLVLACFYSIIPAIFALTALRSMWTYPITQERQRRLRAAIARRNAAHPH